MAIFFHYNGSLVKTDKDTGLFKSDFSDYHYHDDRYHDDHYRRGGPYPCDAGRHDLFHNGGVRHIR